LTEKGKNQRRKETVKILPTTQKGPAKRRGGSSILVKKRSGGEKIAAQVNRISRKAEKN